MNGAQPASFTCVFGLQVSAVLLPFIGEVGELILLAAVGLDFNRTDRVQIPIRTAVLLSQNRESILCLVSKTGSTVLVCALLLTWISRILSGP